MIRESHVSYFNGHQRWLFRVTPLQGESLSSVVERCAFANAVTSRRMLDHLGLPSRGGDLDRHDEAGIATYEDALGYASGALADSTFSRQIGETLTSANPAGQAAWCVGRGAAGVRTDAVCPECLAGDVDLYRRLHWRAGYVSRCERHDRDLIDRCPVCEKPLATIPELRALERGWSRVPRQPAEVTWNCVHCHFVWRPVEMSRATDKNATRTDQPSWRPYQEAILLAHHPAVKHQRLSYAEPPWDRLGCGFTYQFLAGVRALISLMHSPKAGNDLRKLLADKVGCMPCHLYAGGIRGQPFEVYPAESRRHSLDAIAVLLADGIDGMIDILDKARMTSSSLFLTDQYVPNWVQSPMLRHLNGSRYSLSASEVAAARAYAERQENREVEEGHVSGGQATTSAASRPRRATTTTSLSKIAVGRLLGSRDSKELDSALGRIRRRYTRDEAAEFFERALAAVPSVPVSRTQRQVAIRTILILLGVAVRGQAVEEVCGWAAGDVQAMLRDAPPPLKKALMAALQASEHGHAAAVLASRFGARLQGASTRLCAAKLMSEHGAPGTWNSANALAATLAPTQAACRIRHLCRPLNLGAAE